jgi:hypothetical protein
MSTTVREAFQRGTDTFNAHGLEGFAAVLTDDAAFEAGTVRIRTAIIAAISAALLAAGAAHATSVNAPVGTSARAGFPDSVFVGRLKGSDAFVAILVGLQRGARVYVYDSTKRIAAWFDPGLGRPTRFETSPRATMTLISASRDGYHLGAAIGDGYASGNVRFPSGARHRFVAGAVALTDGVYQIEIGPNLSRYLGGWIVWAPGRNLGYLVQAPIVSSLIR